jgi:hypothetical protein
MDGPITFTHPTTGERVQHWLPPLALRIQIRRLVLLLADRISRREDAVIYRAGFSN